MGKECYRKRGMACAKVLRQEYAHCAAEPGAGAWKAGDEVREAMVGYRLHRALWAS